MTRISEFENQLTILLPATYNLLLASNLTIHAGVSRIILHGSRGLKGGYRPDSDIDLSLLVDIPPSLAQSELEALLRAVWETTASNWRGTIEADLAVVFDVRNCGLKCFDRTAFDPELCMQGGVDCFGLYKVQKGFNGLVANAGVQVKRMYPCLKIWTRAGYTDSV